MNQNQPEEKKETKKVAIIRVRGDVNLKKSVKDTLKMLRLYKKNYCVVYDATPPILGMIQKVKDYVTWGEISDEILKKLVSKRGRLVGNKRVSSENVDTIISEIKTKKSKEWSIKPVFRLSPPSGGFHGTIRLGFPRGELGNRKEKINELLERMI